MVLGMGSLFELLRCPYFGCGTVASVEITEIPFWKFMLLYIEALQISQGIYFPPCFLTDEIDLVKARKLKSPIHCKSS